jgi:FKBP-type peptidyl-prolyl cis-trans isomerase 2
MRTAQQGDRVLVHYVMRCQDGSRSSSRGKTPLELIVGTPHRRLPGLGLSLAGMAPGERITLTVPPEQGYGLPDPTRQRRWHRKRFGQQASLQIGQWVRVDAGGRDRLVRVLEVNDKMVLVDTNHPRAGQTLHLEVELLTIDPASQREQAQGEDPWQDVGGEG